MTDRRFYISHAPRFGSYANPQRSKVEQSPYYWWWYALTLNDEYTALCTAMRQTASTSGVSAKAQSNMLKVYEDFGDVQYEGDRYTAFSAWWRDRVNTNEQRGAYLFAEPLRGYWTHGVTNAEEASELAQDDSYILIAVPLNQLRQNASKGAARIINKHIREHKGREVKDPRASKARYHLNTAVQPRALKLAFDVYDFRNDCAIDSIPKQFHKNMALNVRIAKTLGLKYKLADRENYDVMNERKVLSTQVARYLRTAYDMIEHVGNGTFP